MLNSVCLIGRLTRDPEMRSTTTGKQVCSFSLAVSKMKRPSDGSPDADFFDIVAWERQADYVVNYLGKGRLVSIEGRLQTRKYTASDQSQRTVVEIVANNVQALDRPSGATDAKIATAGTAPPADDFDPFAGE